MGWLAYGRSPHVAFQLDDFPAVVENPALTAPVTLAGLLKPSAAGADYVRPVLFLGYRATEALAHRGSGVPNLARRSAAHHLGNLLLHLASALLVLALGRTLEDRIGQRTWAPGLAALLFAVHPALSQGVYYVAARSSVQLTTLALIAVSLALHRPQMKAASITALVATALALLTKEPALAIPALILVVGRLTDSQRQWPLRLAAPHFLLAAAALVLLLSRSAAHFQPPLIDFALMQVRAVFRYAQLLVWPHGLSVDYGWVPPPAAAYWPLSRDFSGGDFRALVVAAVLLTLLLLLALAAGRHRALAAAGTAWFVIALLPTSSLFPIRDPIFEHHLIFAAPGFFLALADAIAAGATAIHRRCPRLVSIIPPLGALILIVLALQARDRSHAWESEQALWADTLAKQPQNPRAAFNLAAAITTELATTRDATERAARRARAEALYRRTLALHPEHAYGYELRAYAYTNLGYLYLDAARSPDALPAQAKADRDRAIAVLDTAITFPVRAGAAEVPYPLAYENLGRALIERAVARRHESDPHAIADAERARTAFVVERELAPGPEVERRLAATEALLRELAAPPAP